MISTIMTPMNARGDAELVSDSLAGDREAFGEIVARYQSLVCSLAYSATGSLSQSEDLAQETFLAAWKHLAELREPAKLRAWLCGIARNLINNWLRAQGREASHGAESLENVPEPRSVEPLPVERAISREEADILWRSLERIPETYRLPLVLFYREHQSIESVAQSLDLTEEAVRQRLSRGRQLLREEVLLFVESALEKTSPGKTFTLAVIAALPVSSAKAVSVGAVAKGAIGAKGILSFSVVGGFLSMLGSILFSWKTLVDDSESSGERKYMVRMRRYQIVFFVVSLLGATVFCALSLPRHPWVFAAVFALLSLANVINVLLVMPYIVRKRVEIRMGEGTGTDTFTEAMQTSMERVFQQQGEKMEAKPVSSDTEKAAKRNALRRAFKITIPMLILLVGTGITLPWKLHWIRCAVVMTVLAVTDLWLFLSTYRRLRFPDKHQSSWRKILWAIFCIAFIPVVFGGGGAVLLNYFLHPELVPTWSEQRPVGIGVLVAVFAVALFLILLFGIVRYAPRWKWLTRILDFPLFQHLQGLQYLGQSAEAVIEGIYAPLVQELNLDSDQRNKLKDLVIKRTTVGARAGISLMNRKLDPAKRSEITQQIQRDTDSFNSQIKEFLGDERYAFFQQFEKTIPDRMMLNQLKKRLAGTKTELSPEQYAGLLKVLTEARGQFPWTTELSRRNQQIAAHATQLTQENLRSFESEEEQFGRQFLNQAREILSPQQVAAFEQIQDRQRRSQLAQHRMAARLLS